MAGRVRESPNSQGAGQKQGYGWICPSQHPVNDAVFAVFDKAFVVERNVNSPAKTQSLSRIRVLVFINIIPFRLVSSRSKGSEGNSEFSHDTQGKIVAGSAMPNLNVIVIYKRCANSCDCSIALRSKRRSYGHSTALRLGSSPAMTPCGTRLHFLRFPALTCWAQE